MAMPEKPPRLALSNMLTQFYPPRPGFTEEDIPSLEGKVYLVTGANTGVGKEVARILYSKSAKVYVAARSEQRANDAIAEIQTACPESRGSLLFHHLDLSDLAAVRQSADSFTVREKRLHVLFNNAAVQALDPEKAQQRTAQGHEIHLGVNVLATYLLTRLLTPMLAATAKLEPSGTVRVVWVSSMGTEMVGEPSKGLSLEYLKYWPNIEPLRRYGISKAGNWLHSVEMARRGKEGGVLSISCNPGHLRSDLYRDGSFIFRTLLNTFIAYHPVYGAYTELFAGLSPSITMEDAGSWIVPWGRPAPIREDLVAATKSEAEGGNGWSSEFWSWSEKQVQSFL